MSHDDDTHLDGDPADFPHREEAQQNYRTLWAAFVLCTNAEHQKLLAQQMDNEQLRISRGPGPLWRAFADTLPGFRNWWARQTYEFLEQMERKLSK